MRHNKKLRQFLDWVVKQMRYSVYAGLDAAASRWNYGLPLTHPVCNQAQHITRQCAEERISLKTFYQRMQKLRVRYT